MVVICGFIDEENRDVVLELLLEENHDIVEFLVVVIVKNIRNALPNFCVANFCGARCLYPIENLCDFIFSNLRKIHREIIFESYVVLLIEHDKSEFCASNHLWNLRYI